MYTGPTGGSALRIFAHRFVVRDWSETAQIGQLSAPTHRFSVRTPSYPPNSVTSKILPRIIIRLIPVNTTMLIQVNARAKADG